MRVINESLLDEFRSATVCELCRRPSWNGLDPAHLLGRGAGRVDIRCNLAALHRECHNRTHADPDALAKLFEIVARREHMTPEEIREKVWRIRQDDRCKVWVVGVDRGEVCPKCERPEAHCECVVPCALCGEERFTCGCFESLPF
jgi:hypothetical protein